MNENDLISFRVGIIAGTIDRVGLMERPFIFQEGVA